MKRMQCLAAALLAALLALLPGCGRAAATPTAAKRRNRRGRRTEETGPASIRRSTISCFCSWVKWSRSMESR